jgi:hypothetical protein
MTKATCMQCGSNNCEITYVRPYWHCRELFCGQYFLHPVDDKTYKIEVFKRVVVVVAFFVVWTLIFLWCVIK